MIEIRDLKYAYKTENNVIQALNNVNLDINEGQWVSIVGANGSGKTTLARHLNGLLLADGGTITVDGKTTGSPNDVWEVRKLVSYIFQNPDNQIIATTVEEDVAFGPENLGIEPKEIRKRVDWALGVVGLSQFKNHEPHLLSGGQKQKVAIAGALAIKPKYLIMDESTSMLDPISRDEILAEIRTLVKDMGIGVVSITHFMEEAIMSDRVIVLHKGEVVMDGTPIEIFSKSDKLKEYKIELPEIGMLSQFLMKDNIINRLILSKEEMVEALCPLK